MTFSQTIILVDTLARFHLKGEARQYLLGYLWWILEPMLYVAVFYIVFEKLLQNRQPDFLYFLMVGKLTFIWFSKSVNQAANSLIAGRGLIGNTDSPKWLFPWAVCHEGLYKQVAVFAVLVVMLLYRGYEPTAQWLWIAPIALTQYVLILGCAMVAALLVCVRQDFQLIVQLGTVFLLFMSGIFWDIDSIANAALRENLLLVNPLAALIDLYRQLLMEGNAPNFRQWGVVVVQSAVILGLTAWAFRALHYWIARRVVTR